MNIKSKIEIIQKKLKIIEKGLRKIYNEILKKNLGQVNNNTELMSEILRTTEDLRKKISMFYAEINADSS